MVIELTQGQFFFLFFFFKLGEEREIRYKSQIFQLIGVKSWVFFNFIFFFFRRGFSIASVKEGGGGSGEEC